MPTYHSIKWSSALRVLVLVITATLFVRLLSDSPESLTSKKSFRRPKFTKKFKPSSNMSANEFLKTISTRRTNYAITNTSPISDSRIEEVVYEAVRHSPSAFNSQAGRQVIVLKAEHEKLWDMADRVIKEAMPPQAYEGLKGKIQGYRRGYGSVLFFEDEAVLQRFKDKHPGLPFDQWSEHASGMAQVHTWTALELEGFGANLQHYNFLPAFTKAVRQEWGLPETYQLKCQLVFGAPVKQPGEKTFLSKSERIKVFGA